MSSLREESLFNEAMGLPTAQARAAFLKEACGGDEGLRRRVEGLIEAAQRTDDFLEQPAARPMRSAECGVRNGEGGRQKEASPPNTPKDAKPEIRSPGRKETRNEDGGREQAEATVVVPIAEKPGDRIGHYKLLEQIGEGGCGVVYMAEQTEPIRRRVAFKVIKLGMDTKSVVARFEAERQALALMDHPNIAKVLDAGATETGRPYFVMELVKGIKITEFCQQNKLSTKERLELFMQVCHAVQHAHQKGIIHRDIKPSNILVTLHDGVPVPKVIDFGIAKATQQPLTDKTMFTAFHQFIGTPAYMSPEQAELSGLDMDTRTDIYSLGVLLYELLVGKPPFEPETLLKAGLDEMRRIIRETEPVKPSTKLAGGVPAKHAKAAKEAGGEAPAESQIADRRSQIESASVRRLVAEVRGDLDWIVMKCLEKDRRRRYETANGLAHDVERHLSHEPVTAAAPSRLYKMRKFMRKHRFGLATAASLVLLLLLGVGVTSCQSDRAQRAEQQARLMTEFRTQMLEDLRGFVGKGQNTALLNKTLDEAVTRVEKEFSDDSYPRAVLYDLIAPFYVELSQYTKAEALYRKSLPIHQELCGSQAPCVGRALVSIAEALDKQGRSVEAEPLLRQAVAIYKQQERGGGANLVASLSWLGCVLESQGKLAEAETAYREALAMHREMGGPEQEGRPTLLYNLGDLLKEQGKPDQAEPLLREALVLHRKLQGSGNAREATLMSGLATALCDRGQFKEAEAMNSEALALRRKLFGQEHSEVAKSLNNLGEVCAKQGRLSEAETLHRDALAMQKRVLRKNDPAIGKTLERLAEVLRKEGKSSEAEALEREAAEQAKLTLPPRAPAQRERQPAADSVYLPAGIVAVVNERVILQSEVREKTAPAAEALRHQVKNNPALLKQKSPTLWQEALENLIRDELICTEAPKAGLTRPDKHTDSAEVREWLGRLRARAFIRHFGFEPAATARPQSRVIKIDIKHIGPSTVSDEQIRSLLHVREGEPVTQADVDQDIRDLYATGDFYNLRVTGANADGGIKLTYLLQERPLLDRIRFTGNTKFSSVDLLRRLTSKTGERLDERNVFEDAREIQNMYRAAGHPQATVKYNLNINEVTGRGSVTFEVTEKP